MLHCPPNCLNRLVETAYYTVWKLDIEGKMEFEQTYPFMIMSVISGDGSINSEPIKKGDHFIIPNAYGKVEISGKLEIIASAV
jgi:beta-glucosidase